MPKVTQGIRDCHHRAWGTRVGVEVVMNREENAHFNYAGETLATIKVRWRRGLSSKSVPLKPSLVLLGDNQ